jgi:hypothetical protein
VKMLNAFLTKGVRLAKLTVGSIAALWAPGEVYVVSGLCLGEAPVVPGASVCMSAPSGGGPSGNGTVRAKGRRSK